MTVGVPQGTVGIQTALGFVLGTRPERESWFEFCKDIKGKLSPPSVRFSSLFVQKISLPQISYLFILLNESSLSPKFNLLDVFTLNSTPVLLEVKLGKCYGHQTLL